MERRAFFAACGAASLTAACARLTYVSGQLDASGQLIVERNAVVGRSGVLVEHASLAFPIFVHHRGGDDYTAVLTRCMHRGCTVEPSDGQLVCPCHGSEYTLSGTILKGPTELPLHAFPVRVDSGRVYILELDKGPR